MKYFKRTLCLLLAITIVNLIYNYEKISNQVKTIGLKNTNFSLHETLENQNGKIVEENYPERVIKYFKKWSDGFKSGNSTLQIYPTLLDETHDLLLTEHQMKKPLNNTKRSIPLSSTLSCTNPDYVSFLSSEKRKKTAKVIDIFPFTYELTLLEVRLYELYDVVDEFVIFESNLTQRKIYKPLFLTQNIEKFSKFIDKITLMTPFNITKFNKDGTINQIVTVKDEDILSEYKTSERIPEKMQNNNEREFFQIDASFEYKFRESIFNLYSTYIRKFDENDDLLIHGDLDEIPSSNIVQHFKYCQVKDHLYPFSFWSTFYVYKFKYIFQSDFPGSGDPFSLTFPNIFRYNDKIRLNSIRFSQGSLLPKLSGAHCNRFYFLITDVYKAMSISDSTGLNDVHMKIINNPTIEVYNQLVESFENGQLNPHYVSRIQTVEPFKSKNSLFIPWIILENIESYKVYF